MAESSSFECLIEAATAGDDEAMRQLIEQYEPDVRLVARLRLGAALRPHLDSMDVVQSVHRNLIDGLRGGKFDISSPEKLIALTLTMVRRKVANHWRHLQRQQRLSGGDAEKPPLPDLLASLHSESHDPHAMLTIRETIDRVIRELDDVERTMVELRLDGYSTAEVARKLNIDPDILRVRLSRLRRRIRELGIMDEWL